MSDMSSTDSSFEPFFTQFEQVRSMVEQEFDVEESFIEYETPTFYIKLRPDSKEAFLRLIKRLEPLGFTPTLRERRDKIVLQVMRKPPVRPSRPMTNVVLLLATIGTTMLTGYILSIGLVEEGYMSNAIVGALTFTAAIMAIFGAHEMGHKIIANKRGIEATAPYFIPGPPPPIGFGTFGAVIQQKSLAPNKDALFDLGSSGPIIGFIVTIIVTIIGIQISSLEWVDELPQSTLPIPLLFDFLATLLITPPPNPTNKPWLLITPHPVAFAGWLGMLVTMLNLIPMGMFDGGHAARGSLGPRARSILSAVAILMLLIFGYYTFALFALILSLGEHPGPLDDVSKLSTSRKLTIIALVAIFVLCIAPIWPF